MAEEHRLDEVGWDDPAVARLWRYNLHYFDDLISETAAERGREHRLLIERWIVENAPREGTGWEPYPTSRRIVNWIKWALAGGVLGNAARDSLAAQARWLAKRLEVHLLGNHLFANAKALLFAGLFFGGPEADEWAQRGRVIIERELDEQVLADGGHFELSPMYHALFLEDVLDLLNMINGPATAPPGTQALRNNLASRVPAMLQWLQAMCHPDGQIAFFNDTALEVAPEPKDLAEYARALDVESAPPPRGCQWLGASGYVRAARAGATLIADIGRIGPDYLPGHAHADTLSFELSLGAERVLVNSGTSQYGSGPQRLWERGTAAHNTVAVAGGNSSEVWSAFRVARRARPLFERVDDAGNEVLISAAHDGYRWLPGRPRHRRRWGLSSGRLLIEDAVMPVPERATAAFYFHPAITWSASSDAATGTLTTSAGKSLKWRISKGDGRLEPATYHPKFGESVPTTRLAVDLQDGCATTEFEWEAA
jgi:uncharacterized heparinase superfamily protein